MISGRSVSIFSRSKMMKVALRAALKFTAVLEQRCVYLFDTQTDTHTLIDEIVEI